ncbi:MAG: response regulator transcription factor, partial [Armatimonadota bacterium]
MPCKVLIVTPDVRLGDATRAALRRRGIEASTCSSPEMALKACHAEELDAVVVDLSLPRSSALDLCRAIHSDVLTPVLVVGPQGTEEDARVLMRLGAEGFMRKPLPARELAAR